MQAAHRLPARRREVLVLRASGGEVLVTGAQRTGGAGILKNGHYSPIPWSSKIFDAAW